MNGLTRGFLTTLMCLIGVAMVVAFAALNNVTGITAGFGLIGAAGFTTAGTAFMQPKRTGSEPDDHE